MNRNIPYARQQAMEAAAEIRRLIAAPPRLGILTGTGLEGAITPLEIRNRLAYRDVPHLPRSTVPGHPGRLLVGTLGGRPTIVFQGRFHLYEGYDARAVTFPIRVLQALGVPDLILLNAAGGLNPALVPGQVMRLADHINLTGVNPLAGPNDDAWGPRFPDMSAAYDPTLGTLAAEAAAAAGLALPQGVYAGLRGPSLETPAEVRFLRAIGADAVGFSTVLETIAAVHAGMRVLGLSALTNVHDPDHPAPASLEAILTVASATAPQIGRLLASLAAKL
jgi:purine-nucleoside phosphorylase